MGKVRVVGFSSKALKCVDSMHNLDCVGQLVYAVITTTTTEWKIGVPKQGATEHGFNMRVTDAPTPASLRAKRLIARCIAMAQSRVRYAQLSCLPHADGITGDVQLAQAETYINMYALTGERGACTRYWSVCMHMQVDASEPRSR